MHTPNDDRLIRALDASCQARLTGALRAETKTAGVTLYFESGLLYFATIDGQRPTTDAFERHGIDRSTLDAASRAPRSEDRFADALMSVGAPARSVRAFGMECVLDGLSATSRMEDAQFSAVDLAHPYGPAFSFDPAQLLEYLGFTATDEEVLAPVNPVSSPPDRGAAFRRRTGLRPAALAQQP